MVPIFIYYANTSCLINFTLGMIFDCLHDSIMISCRFFSIGFRAYKINTIIQDLTQNAWNTGEFIYFDVSNLTRGKHTFELQVQDEYGQAHSSLISVWVLKSQVDDKTINWLWLLGIPLLPVGAIIYVYFRRKRKTTTQILEKI